MSLLAELEARIAGMKPEDRAQLEDMVAGELAKPFLPNPGPQTDAYHCKADILLYGGAAGGGKSGLILGLASTEHHSSLILRRETTQLDGLLEDCRRMVGADDAWRFNGSAPATWRNFKDGRTITFGGMKDAGDWEKFAGRARDFMGFDEAPAFTEEQVASLIAWLRSTRPGQRCRVVLGANPPRTAEGLWILKWFAPWLDPMFENPARSGELRWRVVVGSEIVWVDGPEKVWIDGVEYTPQSLTFIPSRVSDNPYLEGTGYIERLQNMPEHLRKQLLDGDFMAGRGDQDRQVIPAAWVDAAMARWTPPDGKRMMVIFCDVAQGGKDASTTVSLHEDWVFGQIDAKPGAETQDGPSIVSMITQRRRDGAIIGIDCTGGWGGSAADHFRTHNQIEVARVVSSKGSDLRDPHTGYGYRNVRSEMWWEFRIALDPSTTTTGQAAISLPPSPKLKAQLCAPTYTDHGGKILIESKDDIRDRLGSSTDEADAVIGAWKLRSRALTAQKAANSKYPTSYLKSAPGRTSARYPTSYKAR
jgi:hypothetical protein